MVEINHEEIREQLLRRGEGLDPADRIKLEAHLEVCPDCRSFAHNIERLESELRNTFQARWDPIQVPAPEVEAGVYKKSKAPTPALVVMSGLILFILAIFLGRPLMQFLSIDESSQSKRVSHVSEVGPLASPVSTAAIVQEAELDNLIAFVSIRDGNREIYVMNAQGLDATNLTRHSSQDYAPVWSPDGERIVFISDRTGQPELFIMQVDGSMTIRLSTVSGAKAFGEPSWSPDGQQLAVQLILEDPQSGEAYTQIYLVTADGSGAQPMVETEFPLSNLEPKWSPVGNRIASRTLGIMQAVPHADSLYEPEQIRLSRGLTKVGTLAWSPDGLRLAYFASCQFCIDEQDLTPTVHLIDADGKNPRVLYAFEDNDIYSIGMNWSPDGKYLLLLGTEDQGSEQVLFLIERDGSKIIRLADLPQGSMSEIPSWSPDGSQLVYAVGVNGEAGIYILDLQESLNGDPQYGRTRLIASMQGDGSPRWQP